MENPGNELAKFLDHLHADRYNYRDTYVYRSSRPNQRMTQILRKKKEKSE